MDLNQLEQYHKAILRNARDWANGNGLPLYQEDIVVLGDYLCKNIPAAFYKFDNSEKPGEFSASGGFKTIQKTLDQIQKRILNGAIDKFIDTDGQDAEKQRKPSILGQVKENAAFIPPAEKKEPKNKNGLEV